MIGLVVGHVSVDIEQCLGEGGDEETCFQVAQIPCDPPPPAERIVTSTFVSTDRHHDNTRRSRVLNVVCSALVPLTAGSVG